MGLTENEIMGWAEKVNASIPARPKAEPRKREYYVYVRTRAGVPGTTVYYKTQRAAQKASADEQMKGRSSKGVEPYGIGFLVEWGEKRIHDGIGPYGTPAGTVGAVIHAAKHIWTTKFGYTGYCYVSNPWHPHFLDEGRRAGGEEGAMQIPKNN